MHTCISNAFLNKSVNFYVVKLRSIKFGSGYFLLHL